LFKAQNEREFGIKANYTGQQVHTTH